MKTKLIILFILIFTLRCLSQNLDNLKKRDTVYLYFDEKESFVDLHLKKIKGPYNVTFLYQFPDAKGLVFNSFLTKKNEEKKLVSKKNFFQNDKFKILRIEDINKIGYNNLISKFEEYKIVLYIIDKAELKKRKILIRRIFMNNKVNVIL